MYDEICVVSALVWSPRTIGMWVLTVTFVDLVPVRNDRSPVSTPLVLRLGVISMPVCLVIGEVTFPRCMVLLSTVPLSVSGLLSSVLSTRLWLVTPYSVVVLTADGTPGPMSLAVDTTVIWILLKLSVPVSLTVPRMTLCPLVRFGVTPMVLLATTSGLVWFGRLTMK